MIGRWPTIVSLLFFATVWSSKVHVTASQSTLLPTTTQTPQSPIVAGYLPDYRFGINLNETAGYLTDLILFSIAPTNEGDVDRSCCLDGSHYELAFMARHFLAQKNDHTSQENYSTLRLFVSVGGAGRSTAFATIVKTLQSRRRFISNLIQLCRNNGLQGVDFDWEQPASQEEWIGYLYLILEASRDLHEENLLVSVALHPRQRMVPQVYDVVDRINLMTYDMITQQGGHHAELSEARKAVEQLVQTGCPSHKIVLGIPAYARHVQHPGLVKTFSEVVHMAAKVHRGGSMNVNYGEIVSEMDGSFEGYSFDSPAYVAEKVVWARSNGLAGVFLWEVGQDLFGHSDGHDVGLLLQTAFLATKKSLEDEQLSFRKEL